MKPRQLFPLVFYMTNASIMMHSPDDDKRESEDRRMGIKISVVVSRQITIATL